MTRQLKIILLPSLLLFIAALFCFTKFKDSTDHQILAYTVNLENQDLKFFWKDDKGENLKTIENLKNYVTSKNQRLIFAVNGGMFKKDYSPQGLFIENNKTLAVLNRANGNGNFYLKPNGVFYITNDNIPFVSKTSDFLDNGKIKYATQSGPMLVIDGKIHSEFKDGSTNLNIRNGVGILPNNKVVFAVSKMEINLYDFAKYFQSLGCKNALYLDGFVSRTYLPEKNWTNTDGDFGVLIGVTVKK